MYTKWTDNITDKEQKLSFEREVQSSKRVLDRIKEILETEYEIILRYEADENSFETPNWALLQAYKNGQRNMASKIIKLIDLDKQV